MNLSPKDFFEININVPSSRNEQIKIAKFLTLLDKKLDLLSNKIEALKKYKEGLVNICFSEGQKTQISTLINQVDRRNKNNENLTVFSISNKNGFVSQADQFDGNEVASTNKENYKIVHKDEFAYNPARINVGSIAYLKEGTGQVSPMYIVFSIHGISNILLYEYFRSRYFRKELKKHLEGSVRQTLSFENLCDFTINIPSSDVSFDKIFIALNHKLSLVEKNLFNLQTIKHYLLKNMFI